VRPAPALWGVPVACAAGALLARVWIARAPHALARDLAQPLPVATAWGNYGTAGFCILAAALGAATVALVCASRARRADTAVVVAVAAAALAANLAWPVTFSSDPYAYAAYGDLATRGVDPYRLAPPALHDAPLDAARYQWSGAFPVCVYGPAFVLFARAIVTIANGAGSSATLWVFRAAACAAFLASIALLGVALRDRTRERRSFALYAYGLNPVALWTVAEGHNDAILICCAAAAFACARRFPAGAAFALALGPLVKAPGAVLAVVYAARAAWLEGTQTRAVWLATAAGGAAAVALALPPLLPALRHVATAGVYAPAVSLQGLLGLPAAALLAAAMLANSARLLLRRERRGFAWAGLALLAALPNAYPWYVLWLVPLALAAGDCPSAAALWFATIFAAMRYLPDAAGNMTLDAARAAAAVAALPFALALAEFRPAALRGKTPTPP